ncbi:MAG: agmatinase [Dehalococcoidia bacterium]|nr:MAG: agmatinase [Dehalococcoidia bacterium]
MKREFFYPQRNFAATPEQYADFETSRVVILPIPYDSTTDWRSGSRDGPMAIIDASQYLELYDHELDREIYLTGIHTLPELEPSMKGPEQTVERVYNVVSELVQKGKLVAMLGGEHSLTAGMVKAFRERFDRLCVLQLDAHADLRDEYQGTKYSHACVMRRVLECCPIVQVGVRTLSQEEHRFLAQNQMRPFFTQGRPLDQPSLDEMVSALSEEVYVTIDLDVLDPSIMSAVSTPEPGGMGWYEILRVLRQVAQQRHVVGFDLVELCPKEGPSSCAFLAAKLAYKLIGYVLSP